MPPSYGIKAAQECLRATYDQESRITSVTRNGQTVTYAYNGLDTRTSVTMGSTVNTFLRDGAYVTDPVLVDSGATYTPGISERRGMTTTYLHSGLRNAFAQSGAAQTLAAVREYDAFGNVTSSSGAWAGPFGYAGKFGYQSPSIPGTSTPDEGLKLMGHRYYDPSTGRFLTRDPIFDGRNWYSYGGGEGNPLTGADPTGLVFESIGGAVGFTAGVAGGYALSGAKAGAVVGGVKGAAVGLVGGFLCGLIAGTLGAAGGAAADSYLKGGNHADASSAAQQGGHDFMTDPTNVLPPNVKIPNKFLDAVVRRKVFDVDWFKHPPLLDYGPGDPRPPSSWWESHNPLDNPLGDMAREAMNEFTNGQLKDLID